MEKLLQSQKAYFKTGETFSYAFRIKQLKKLKDIIKKHESAILNALYIDLHKNRMEAYTTEVGFVYHSIDKTIKHLKKWMRIKKVKTPLYMLGTKSYIMPEPLGNILIIGPYNYPFQLIIEPLIGAISAGNTAVIKPSEFVKETESVLKLIIEEAFDESYISIVLGDHIIAKQLTSLRFDHIFFTGSTQVGKLIYQEASKQLIPVTLELGGKSPTIVCKDANLTVSARRIVFGKFINAGQTCIAPDYIYVDASIEKPFLELLKSELEKMYPDDQSMAKVIPRHIARLNGLVQSEKVFYQAPTDTIGPVIMHQVDWSDSVMQAEIFGPLLPVLTFSNLDDLIHLLQEKEKPLALYLFTEDKAIMKKVFERLSFGGGAINDTIMHVANSNLPFGGIGYSGIGAYHGKHSFDLFSKEKGYIKKTTKFDPKLAYPPYTSFKEKLIKKFLK